MTTSQNTQHAVVSEQLRLADEASKGNEKARHEINQIVAPVIEYNTNRFCKRFCRENQHLYRCTLSPPMGKPTPDMHWCEWGNGSYAWMLNDLTARNRLQSYRGIRGARLFDYFYQIANSLPFYERWKDWRFGRRTHVPDYIRRLSSHAAAVFLALKAGEKEPSIAQTLGLETEKVRQLIHSIVQLLATKKRLYLLDTPKQVSLSAGETDTNHLDIEPVSPEPPIEQVLQQAEQHSQLRAAWDRLSAVEQYVIEALVIEDQQAEDVLKALSALNIRIKEDTPATDTNRQQLYYFRRKTLEKLVEILKQTAS